MSKSELRQEHLLSRRAIPRGRVAELSQTVEQNLAALKEFRDADIIASYVAVEDEVQTARIIESAISDGKRVAVPLVDRSSDRLIFYEIGGISELSLGGFGILEPSRSATPLALDDADLVLVPLIVWDERGHRVGYGKGYFDRALAERGSAVAVGLAFESQAVARIPAAPSDVPLDVIVTEKRTIRFGDRTG